MRLSKTNTVINNAEHPKDIFNAIFLNNGELVKSQLENISFRLSGIEQELSANDDGPGYDNKISNKLNSITESIDSDIKNIVLSASSLIIQRPAIDFLHFKLTSFFHALNTVQTRIEWMGDISKKFFKKFQTFLSDDSKKFDIQEIRDEVGYDGSINNILKYDIKYDEELSIVHNLMKFGIHLKAIRQNKINAESTSGSIQHKIHSIDERLSDITANKLPNILGEIRDSQGNWEKIPYDIADAFKLSDFFIKQREELLDKYKEILIEYKEFKKAKEDLKSEKKKLGKKDKEQRESDLEKQEKKLEKKIKKYNTIVKNDDKGLVEDCELKNIKNKNAKNEILKLFIKTEYDNESDLRLLSELKSYKCSKLEDLDWNTKKIKTFLNAEYENIKKLGSLIEEKTKTTEKLSNKKSQLEQEKQDLMEYQGTDSTLWKDSLSKREAKVIKNIKKIFTKDGFIDNLIEWSESIRNSDDIENTNHLYKDYINIHLSNTVIKPLMKIKAGHDVSYNDVMDSLRGIDTLYDDQKTCEITATYLAKKFKDQNQLPEYTNTIQSFLNDNTGSDVQDIRLSKSNYKEIQELSKNIFLTSNKSLAKAGTVLYKSKAYNVSDCFKTILPILEKMVNIKKNYTNYTDLHNDLLFILSDLNLSSVLINQHVNSEHDSIYIGLLFNDGELDSKYRNLFKYENVDLEFNINNQQNTLTDFNNAFSDLLKDIKSIIKNKNFDKNFDKNFYKKLTTTQEAETLKAHNVYYQNTKPFNDFIKKIKKINEGELQKKIMSASGSIIKFINDAHNTNPTKFFDIKNEVYATSYLNAKNYPVDMPLMLEHFGVALIRSIVNCQKTDENLWNSYYSEALIKLIDEIFSKLLVDKNMQELPMNLNEIAPQIGIYGNPRADSFQAHSILGTYLSEHIDSTWTKVINEIAFNIIRGTTENALSLYKVLNDYYINHRDEEDARYNIEMSKSKEVSKPKEESKSEDNNEAIENDNLNNEAPTHRPSIWEKTYNVFSYFLSSSNAPDENKMVLEESIQSSHSSDDEYALKKIEVTPLMDFTHIGKKEGAKTAKNIMKYVTYENIVIGAAPGHKSKLFVDDNNDNCAFIVKDLKSGYVFMVSNNHVDVRNSAFLDSDTSPKYISDKAWDPLFENTDKNLPESSSLKERMSLIHLNEYQKLGSGISDHDLDTTYNDFDTKGIIKGLDHVISSIDNLKILENVIYISEDSKFKEFMLNLIDGHKSGHISLSSTYNDFKNDFKNFVEHKNVCKPDILDLLKQQEPVENRDSNDDISLRERVMKLGDHIYFSAKSHNDLEQLDIKERLARVSHMNSRSSIGDAYKEQNDDLGDSSKTGYEQKPYTTRDLLPGKQKCYAPNYVFKVERENKDYCIKGKNFYYLITEDLAYDNQARPGSDRLFASWLPSVDNEQHSWKPSPYITKYFADYFDDSASHSNDASSFYISDYSPLTDSLPNPEAGFKSLTVSYTGKVHMGSMHFDALITYCGAAKSCDRFYAIFRSVKSTTELKIQNIETGEEMSVSMEPKTEITVDLVKIQNYLHISSKVLKPLDLVANILRAMSKPTYENLKDVYSGSLHTYTLFNGFNNVAMIGTGFSIVVDTAPKIFEGKYSEAAWSGSTVVAGILVYSIAVPKAISHISPKLAITYNILTTSYIMLASSSNLLKLLAEFSDEKFYYEASTAQMDFGKFVASTLSYIIPDSVHNFTADACYYTSKSEYFKLLASVDPKISKDVPEKLYKYIYLPFIEQQHSKNTAVAGEFNKTIVNITLSEGKGYICLRPNATVSAEQSYHCYESDKDEVYTVIESSNGLEFTAVYQNNPCIDGICYSY
ncbi:hypothetical protein Cyrtocomes_00793 [Candidatus Cyrtobacter comes]|uniref:Uncharacterized protein n=2 Tax=Candidatus Cyrtobacter comes TaxID=675776 RepID=A0ABU5L8G9_9RICK|nr:hypothetical protein [Candidatus Cyrtobacter comes]